MATQVIRHELQNVHSNKHNAAAKPTKSTIINLERLANASVARFRPKLGVAKHDTLISGQPFHGLRCGIHGNNVDTA